MLAAAAVGAIPEIASLSQADPEPSLRQWEFKNNPSPPPSLRLARPTFATFLKVT
jgi:hypothetical protein